MKQIQRKAAKAALGCLVLLLLYGCASHAAGIYGGEAEEDADFSWTGHGPDEAEDAAGADVSRAGREPDGDTTGNETGGGPERDAADGAASSPGTVAVYVCGAVKTPGVYELAAGSRVYEAVALAGGMTEEASARSVNQAGLLEDGQMVVILTKEETAACAGPDGAAEPGDGRVNINTADAQELKTLPGVGDAKAAAIIDYREQNGAFAAVPDIQNVSGIGERMFARLESLIKVE